MFFLVKVRVNLKTMAEFGRQLQKGNLDRSSIISETWCVKDDPSVGYSVWKTGSRNEFDGKFDPWKQFYESAEITEAIPPDEAMKLLTARI
jgi:hypothetical protein